MLRLGSRVPPAASRAGFGALRRLPHSPTALLFSGLAFLASDDTDSLRPFPEPPPATAELRGVVYEAESEKPVPFAQVIVVGTRQGGMADDQGRFRIQKVPPGMQTIRAQALGFESLMLATELAEGESAYLSFRFANRRKLIATSCDTFEAVRIPRRKGPDSTRAVYEPFAQSVRRMGDALEPILGSPRSERAFDETWFSFSLPDDRQYLVSAIMYDARGRRVRTFLDGDVLRGTRFGFHWDGYDDRSLSVPPGVYLARIATARKILALQLVVVPGGC